MWPDAIAPVGAAATAAVANLAGGLGARSTTAPGQDFATLLDAQQRPAASLPTVTFGEMTGLSADLPATPASIAAPAAAAVAPQATAAPGTMAWPVRGRVTSEFGPRVHPITGVRRPHQGIDIAASTGTPIAAPVAGKVTFAGTQGGYGNVVIVDHGNGLETRYAHQDTIAVTAGQAIVAGQQLGTVGSTGLSTGPHLHFEVRRDGEAVDPRRFLG